MLYPPPLELRDGLGITLVRLVACSGQALPVLYESDSLKLGTGIPLLRSWINELSLQVRYTLAVA